MKTILIVVLASCWLPIVKAAFGFNETTKTVTYPEGVTAGSNIYQTTVIDTPASETVTYTLTEAEVTGENTQFEVTDNGLVKLKVDQTLDFETKQSHELTITCSAVTPPSSSTLTLVVKVTDIEPSFGETSYYVNIADGSTADSILGTYKATIPGDTSLHHTIEEGNTNDDFVMDKDDGVIKVSTGRTLNKTRTATYTLILHATGIGETGTATVNVRVVDGSESRTSALSASLLTLMVWVLAYWIKG